MINRTSWKTGCRCYCCMEIMITLLYFLPFSFSKFALALQLLSLTDIQYCYVLGLHTGNCQLKIQLKKKSNLHFKDIGPYAEKS